MTKEVLADSASPSARYDRAEDQIARYPDITEEELAQLKRWFFKEASAFEAASIASKEPLAYAKFKADHLERFSRLEVVLATAVIFAAAATVYLFI